MDTYECSICRDLMFRPVSLSCQHVFCLHCLEEHIRHSRKRCPICRSRFFFPPDYNKFIEILIKERYPEKYEERCKEIGDIKERRRLENQITMDILQANEPALTHPLSFRNYPEELESGSYWDKYLRFIEDNGITIIYGIVLVGISYIGYKTASGNNRLVEEKLKYIKSNKAVNIIL